MAPLDSLASFCHIIPSQKCDVFAYKGIRQIHSLSAATSHCDSAVSQNIRTEQTTVNFQTGGWGSSNSSFNPTSNSSFNSGWRETLVWKDWEPYVIYQPIRLDLTCFSTRSHPVSLLFATLVPCCFCSHQSDDSWRNLFGGQNSPLFYTARGKASRIQPNVSEAWMTLFGFSEINQPLPYTYF